MTTTSKIHPERFEHAQKAVRSQTTVKGSIITAIEQIADSAADALKEGGDKFKEGKYTVEEFLAGIAELIANLRTNAASIAEDVLANTK